MIRSSAIAASPLDAAAARIAAALHRLSTDTPARRAVAHLARGKIAVFAPETAENHDGGICAAAGWAHQAASDGARAGAAPRLHGGSRVDVSRARRPRRSSRPPGRPACVMSTPRRSTVSAWPSGRSAMRCATIRARNGRCRPKSGGCCGPTRPGLRRRRRHHPLPFDPVYDYSYDAIMPRSAEDSLQRLGSGADRHPLRARYRHLPARRRAPRSDEDVARDSGYRALESLHGRQRGSGRSASASTSGKCCSRRWNGASGTPSCWPAALYAPRTSATLDDLLPKCLARRGPRSS